MGNNKSEGSQKQRGKYKPPMGCFAKIVLTVVIIGVVLIAAMALHYWYLKRSNPDLTLNDYLTSTYESTKTTVTRYRDKAVEWKEWLAKSEKTREWLDKIFPPREEVDETATATGEQSESGTTAVSPPEKALHPEFQAAADEFRAGLEHFQKRENNEAYERFTRAQDHLDNYKKINPNDPRIEDFERELAKIRHAAMKDSKVR